MSRLKDWALEKYSRTMSKDTWRVMESSATYQLILILSKTGELTVEAGGNILEYWTLIKNRQLKAEMRGECIEFLCTTKEVYKWEIKFTGGTFLSKTNCANCFCYIKSFLDPPAKVLPLIPMRSSNLAASSSASVPVVRVVVGKPDAVPNAPAVSIPAPTRKKPRTNKPTGAVKRGRPKKNPGSLEASCTPPIVDDASCFAKINEVRPLPEGILPFASNSSASVGQVSVKGLTNANASNSWAGVGQVSLSGLTNANAGTSTGELHRSMANLGDVPDLEQMVRLVLQDPKLPDLVEAVHKVISNM